MEMVILIIATAFNIVILKWKFENKRYADGIFDTSILVGLAFVFGSTLGGMAIATGSSALISLYLLWDPIEFSKFEL